MFNQDDTVGKGVRTKKRANCKAFESSTGWIFEMEY